MRLFLADTNGNTPREAAMREGVDAWCDVVTVENGWNLQGTATALIKATN